MKFITQSFVLICIVFLGILGGIQIANSDSEHQNYQQTDMIDAGTNKNGEAAVEVLGQNLNFAEKEKQLQEMKSFNSFSKVGEKFAATVEKTVEIAVEPVLTKMEQIINGDTSRQSG